LLKERSKICGAEDVDLVRRFGFPQSSPAKAGCIADPFSGSSRHLTPFAGNRPAIDRHGSRNPDTKLLIDFGDLLRVHPVLML
jgi:hypothetical protein